MLPRSVEHVRFLVRERIIVSVDRVRRRLGLQELLHSWGVLFPLRTRRCLRLLVRGGRLRRRMPNGFRLHRVVQRWSLPVPMRTRRLFDHLHRRQLHDPVDLTRRRSMHCIANDGSSEIGKRAGASGSDLV